MTRFYCNFREWSKEYPAPVHPKHGPQQTPPILIWEISDCVPSCGTPIHTEQGEIHAGAPWESPQHPDNVAALALAERICAELNGEASSSVADVRIVDTCDKCLRTAEDVKFLTEKLHIQASIIRQLRGDKAGGV